MIENPQVGDRVRLIDAGGGDRGELGDTGTITNVGRTVRTTDGAMLTVRLTSGSDEGADVRRFARRFERVVESEVVGDPVTLGEPETWNDTFPLGTEVQFPASNESYPNRRGRVTYHDTDRSIRIEDSASGLYTYVWTGQQLHVVTRAETPKSTPVGTRVTIRGSELETQLPVDTRVKLVSADGSGARRRVGLEGVVTGHCVTDVHVMFDGTEVDTYLNPGDVVEVVSQPEPIDPVLQGYLLGLLEATGRDHNWCESGRRAGKRQLGLPTSEIVIPDELGKKIHKLLDDALTNASIQRPGADALRRFLPARTVKKTITVEVEVAEGEAEDTSSVLAAARQQLRTSGGYTIS